MKIKLLLAISVIALTFASCGTYDYGRENYGYSPQVSANYGIESESYGRSSERAIKSAPAEAKSADWDEWFEDDEAYYDDKTKSDDGYISSGDGKPADTTSVPDKTEAQSERELKIIYTADITLGVYDPEDIKIKVIAELMKLGGFVESESNMRLVLRVPADSFKIMLDEIINFGRVISKNIFTQDVTEEFYDLVSRLAVMKDTLAVLAEMLKQAKTKQLQLEILREMRILQEQIERSEARLRYLRDKVSYSTITLDLRLEQQLVSSPKQIKIPVSWLNSHNLENLIK